MRSVLTNQSAFFKLDIYLRDWLMDQWLIEKTRNLEVVGSNPDTRQRMDIH